ncbi:e3 ufm1-protein ligase 1 [Holotrichia oblita]|uniref:E3 ufm1-protein ligase 1 n=1 Tax=Holotrichia oblita TaxID=644536 RepID=A0ACB9STZ9_HOLOL|nr:e3 ufm1-protein ligase 1 [Holotrichia oblita]
MADWDEIKRLAADFQKVQLSSSTQRLSERNCIEIVTWLIQRKMVDLIFTSDGKEYMTPSHLINDIRGELYVNGGRVNLVELAKIIGVDLSHINAHLNDVLKGHKDIHSVLGQLVDSTYITKIAGEINEKLQQQGQININDLTLQYDLPAEFLQLHVVEKNIGKLIFGKQDKKDPRIFFTETFIARTKAKIRGALIGLTKPTPITVILSHADVSERLFFSLFDQCCSYGTLTSRLVGAQYIPNIYTRSQNEWVNNFYKQNGYLEFDALNRLGISDYKTYLKKLFANDDTISLNSCVISKNILDRAEADIEECISSKSYLDLQSNLPSVFNEQDIQIITETILNTKKLRETVVIENYILSKAFLENLIADCSKKLEENANKVVENGKYQHYQTDLQISSLKTQKSEDQAEEVKVDKREERRKKATGGKSGGGTQGRETKTKSTKKHYRGGKTQVDDDEVPERKSSLEIISIEEIFEVIQEKLEEEGLDMLIDPIANYLHPILNERGMEVAANVYASTVSDRTSYRRHTHNELQNKVNALVGDVRLFEKGIKLFPSDTQIHLNKYLLKTLCTDITNELLNYVAAEENMNTVTDNFTNEQRLKFANDLSQTYKNAFSVLVKTLSGQTVEEFLNSIDDALATCSMILKKIDKKKDRVVILNHKHSLLEQLDKCDDPALALHLTSLILFVSATQNMLHASGRHVSSILVFLKQYLSPEQAEELSSYHEFVTLMLGGGSETENAKERLKEKLPIIKRIATEFKKINPEKS